VAMVEGVVAYLEKQAEGSTGDKGITIDHILEENRTARLRVVGAESAIEGCW